MDSLALTERLGFLLPLTDCCCDRLRCRPLLRARLLLPRGCLCAFLDDESEGVVVAVVTVVVLALRVVFGCGRYKDERDRFFPLVQHKYGLLFGVFSAVVVVAAVERTGNRQNPLKNLERREGGDAALARLGLDLDEGGCCLLRGRTSSIRSGTTVVFGAGTGSGD